MSSYRRRNDCRRNDDYLVHSSEDSFDDLSRDERSPVRDRGQAYQVYRRPGLTSYESELVEGTSPRVSRRNEVVTPRSSSPTTRDDSDIPPFEAQPGRIGFRLRWEPMKAYKYGFNVPAKEYTSDVPFYLPCDRKQPEGREVPLPIPFPRGTYRVPEDESTFVFPPPPAFPARSDTTEPNSDAKEYIIEDAHPPENSPVLEYVTTVEVVAEKRKSRPLPPKRPVPGRRRIRSQAGLRRNDTFSTYRSPSPIRRRTRREGCDDPDDYNEVDIDYSRYRRQNYISDDSDSSSEDDDEDEDESKPQQLNYDRLRINRRTVRIYSLHLVNALRAVSDYSSVMAPKFTSSEPFLEIPADSFSLPHLYKKLQAYKDHHCPTHDSEYTKTLNEHIDILLAAMPLVEAQLQDAQELAKTGRAQLASAWSLFSPGTMAWTTTSYTDPNNEYQQTQKYKPCIIHGLWGKIQRRRGGRNRMGDWTILSGYNIEVWFVESDKKRPGRMRLSKKTEFMWNLSGKWAINRWPIVPHPFVPSPESYNPKDIVLGPLAVNEHIDLGRRYWEMAAAKRPLYMEVGPGIDVSGYRLQIPKFMSRRVVVDIHGKTLGEGFGPKVVVNDDNFVNPRVYGRRTRRGGMNALNCVLPGGPVGFRPKPCDQEQSVEDMFWDRSRVIGLSEYEPACLCQACRRNRAGDVPKSRWNGIDSLEPGVDSIPRCTEYLFAMQEELEVWSFGLFAFERVDIRHLVPFKSTASIEELIFEAKPELESLVQSLQAHPRENPELTMISPWKTPRQIILFHGPEGTGKHTALVQLAESTRRPVLCYQLGWFTDSRMEERFFEIAKTLGAILLYDPSSRATYESYRSYYDTDGYMPSIEKLVGRDDVDPPVGPVIAIAKSITNVNQGFLSETHTHIPFKHPNKALRRQIWRNKLDVLEAQNMSRYDSKTKIYVMPQVRTYVDSPEVEALSLSGLEISTAVQSFVFAAQGRTRFHTTGGDNFEQRPFLDIELEDAKKVISNIKSKRQPFDDECVVQDWVEDDEQGGRRQFWTSRRWERKPKEEKTTATNQTEEVPKEKENVPTKEVAVAKPGSAQSPGVRRQSSVTSHFGSVLANAGPGVGLARRQSSVSSHFGTGCGGAEWGFVQSKSEGGKGEGVATKGIARKGSMASHFGGSVVVAEKAEEGDIVKEVSEEQELVKGGEDKQEPQTAPVRKSSMGSHFGSLVIG